MSAPIATIDDKIREAQRLKDEGNEFVKAGDFRKALNRYAKVFLYVNGLVDSAGTATSMGAMLGQSARGPAASAEQKATIAQLQFSAHSNSALCFLKCSEFDKALASCNKALELQGDNAKVVFRRGQAHHALGAIDAAAADVERALAQTPNDPLCRAELAAIRAKQRDAEKKHAQAFAGMFDKMASGGGSAE